MNRWFGIVAVALVSLGVVTLSGCQPKDGPRVVVYTALDPVFSRTIFERFERETGIRVDAVFDTEATKTTGLVERVRREKDRPRCDVFWNNEVLRTVRLANDGVLAPYASPSAAGIPASFKDGDGLWTGFAARARVVAFDPERVDPAAVPQRHFDLLDSRWSGKIAIADPRFGTTGSHLACLYTLWGEAEYRRFLEGLAANGAQVVGGNSVSRDRVLSGEALLGLTDTDDVEVVRQRMASIEEAYFAAEGTIVLPNTVALVKGGPNPELARKFIDFVLSESIEEELAASKSRQIPVRETVAVPESGLRLSAVPQLAVSFAEAAENLPTAIRIAVEILR